MEKKYHEAVSTPFLRWTGSKRWFVKEHIASFLPREFNNYHEPFLGGGAVFFHILNNSKVDRQYFLSDINPELINAYIQIRDQPEAVIGELRSLHNSKEEYYNIRAWRPRRNEKRAAKFIYQNRTSFNGIYRVNNKGVYNVPYGYRTNVDIVTEELLINVSKALFNVSIQSVPFEETIEAIQKNDLVFIDPPYTVAHENNGFIEYNQKLFSWEDQVQLKDYILRVIEKEAYFMLTNASHQSIRDLYNDIGKLKKLSRLSKVGGRVKTRALYNELLIHNIH